MAFDPQEAVEFMRQVAEAESSNRQDGLADLRFRFGEQWKPDDMVSRQLTGRPYLTINETDSYCRQVESNQRQQRPRIKVDPVNITSDVKIAKVLTGLTRHIELNSDADQAYDTAFMFADTMGWGYWRVVTDYMREDSFDQDIYIRQIENPFTVYFDNNSTLPDGSDAEKALVTDQMAKKAFNKAWPGAQDSGFVGTSAGDTLADWLDKDNIRIAEYFKVEKEKAKLVMLSDRTVTWADKLPPAQLLAQAGVSVVGDRDSYRRTVEWRKVTAFEVLETKKWAGRWIPIVPVYGTQVIIDGKRKRFGLVRNAKDPQIMVNYWHTAATESIALAPKAKWLMAEGQDEGHEQEWARANISATPVLHYKITDISGKEHGKPERLQPEPPPEGIISAGVHASANLQKVMGMFDPATRTGGPTSGKALQGERSQSEMNNFHYFDNLTRSIRHTGRIILDLVPHIYDRERMVRIIGDDDKPEMVTLNQPQAQLEQAQSQDPNAQQSPNEEAIQTILNDVTVGDYDVVMDTGPGFNSKRQEALEGFGTLMQGPLGDEIAKVGGDLVVRLYDAPGMDVLADRMAAANPLAQIDEKDDIPPATQMKIKGLEQQLQQMQQQLQAAAQEIKLKTGIVQMQENAETQREHMRQTVKAHISEVEDKGWQRDVDERSATKRHDTEVRALTAQNVAEINGLVKLLTEHLSTAQFEKQAQREDAQAEAKANETEPQT